MDKQIKYGFSPIYDTNSRVLILGSFPSVKSREISFYYGNKQNRFWKTVCSFFEEEVPENTEQKKDFLFRRGIALWDVVTACEIDGSSDASIRNAEIADVGAIIKGTKIEKILLNGKLAFDLFKDNFAWIDVPFLKMPSTIPANPRFNEEIWRRELAFLK